MARWWLLFHRPMRERVSDLEKRVTVIEEQTEEKVREVESVRQRLRYLEIQAEVIARRHLKDFTFKPDEGQI